MQITGFPRSGSSLLLLLLAGTVTNRKVYSERESHRKGRGQKIAKCPFALFRDEYESVLLTVRDPRNVVTSDTHGQFKGYVVGWKGGIHKGLEAHWQAMQRYLDRSLLVRYEALVSQPDEVQERIGAFYGLEFSRPFSEWPEGFEINEYWQARGLGKVTTFRAPRDWRDDPRHVERVAQQERHPGFVACCEALGYA